MRPDPCDRPGAAGWYDGRPVTTNQFRFPWEILRAIIAGASAVDLEGLAFRDRRHAVGFLAAYGYDPKNASTRAELEILKAKALTFLREELLADEPDLNVPDEIAGLEVADLLTLVSDHQGEEGVAWACALLRVMHAFAHSRNDPFEKYRDVVQRQILDRIQRHLVQTDAGLMLGRGQDAVPLSGFRVKEQKSPHRVVMKLLHKPGNLGESIHDYVGVRFIAADLMDVMQVVRFLRVHNVVVFANVAPERSRNTLLDLDRFQTLLTEVTAHDPDISEDELRGRVNAARLSAPGGTNERSSSSYRAIHFTVRQLVTLPVSEEESIRIFFPFEVQVMDRVAAEELVQGDAAHEEYSRRQRRGVKRRVLRGLLRRRGRPAETDPDEAGAVAEGAPAPDPKRPEHPTPDG